MEKEQTTQPAAEPKLAEGPHVSHSEMITWLECQWRHKLKYLEGLDFDSGNEHTSFGHAIHEALKQYLETRVMPAQAVVVESFVKELQECKAAVGPADWHDQVEPILQQVPAFLDEAFPGWEYVAAEQLLYEDIVDEPVYKFKGYIDGIIKVPHRPRKGSTKPAEGHDYWIIDWKTCGWGWDVDQKTSFKKTSQLALYKYFWTKKLGIDLKDVKCGFILLKRTSNKKNERCELVPVSVGPKAVENALTTIDSMLGSLRKGFANKNRSSCRYCVYYRTEHCK